MQRIRKLAPLLLLSVIWFSIGWLTNARLSPTTADDPPAVRHLAQVANAVIERQYTLNNLDPERFSKVTIDRMLELSEDPYASYYRPPYSARFQANFDGNIGATGIRFAIKDGQFTVTHLQPGSTGAEAGIQVGDVIRTIAGVETINLTPGEAILLLGGAVDETVQLELERTGQPYSVTVGRTLREALTAHTLEGEIGYLKLTAFSPLIVAPTKAALQALQKEGIRALIWDLRDNQGGSMRATEEILSYLFPKATTLYRVEFKDGQQLTIQSSGAEPFAVDLPLVVLVNGETYSSSEMAAAAIVDQQRGVVLGVQTGGKGMIQDTVTLEEGYLLRYSIAKWFTPQGTWVHHTGFPPTHEVADDPATPEDEQLAAAITYVQQELLR